MTGDPSKRTTLFTPRNKRRCQKCGKDCKGANLYATATAAEIQKRGKKALVWLCADCLLSEAKRLREAT